MIKQILYKDNLNYIKGLPINIKEVFNADDPDVEKSINNFNELYVWKDMFTVEIVKKRLEEKQRLFLFYLNGLLVGHSWFSDKAFSVDYPEINEIKFNFPSLYIYNLFIDKRKHQKSIFNSSQYLAYCIKQLMDEGFEKFYLYVDDWNVASLTNTQKTGFIISDW